MQPLNENTMDHRRSSPTSSHRYPSLVLLSFVMILEICCSGVRANPVQGSMRNVTECAHACQYPCMQCEYFCRDDSTCKKTCQHELTVCVRNCYANQLSDNEMLRLMDPERQP
ncbi:hypothetical protein PHET_07146 [Paragonimus heterotremus]|uniref:Uncharacterized protein n=1 Tax=Paragonimus heterotremus TaxID=100268 RepID=A0A8J4WH95_9TREM|nr:hypothetical protein PHET_07146 [Paragonimus heterotremus]